MATGDQADMLARLRAVLPPWFPDDSAILSGTLAGLAAGLSFGYALIQFARAQTRIATASGGWLDLIAWDYFAARFTRRQGQSDASFSAGIIKEVLRPRQTRAAITLALQDLTGKTPTLFEPWNPGDCGAYGGPNVGYGTAGCYGSLQYPAQIFVTAYRANGSGVPNVGGYGVGLIGYGVAGEYIDMSQIVGPVTDAEIYAQVARTVAAGVIAWTAIENNPPVPPAPTPTFDSLQFSADRTALTMDKQ